MAKVYWSGTAQADLDTIALYIAEHSEQNALAFIDTVDGVVQLLSRKPRHRSAKGRVRAQDS